MIARLYQSTSCSTGKPLPPRLMPLLDPARRFSHSFNSVAGSLPHPSVPRGAPPDPHYHFMKRDTPAGSDRVLSSQSVVGIGDAENDPEFLGFCGGSVAVANAIPSLKQRAQSVTRGSYGAGVTEVIDRLIDKYRLR